MSEMLKRVEEALASVASTTSGCYSDRCCCSGVEAFECKTQVSLGDLARAAIAAMLEDAGSLADPGGDIALHKLREALQ